MKICLQWPGTLASASVTGEASSLINQFIDVAKIGARPDTELVPRFLTAGFKNIHDGNCRYTIAVNDYYVLESYYQAEKEGYDAIVMHCMYDCALYPGRTICNIPIVGALESSLLLANMMGRKLAVVNDNPGQTPLTEENLVKYGMREKAIDKQPVRSLSMSLEEHDMKSESVIEDFKKRARSCIEDGAEVIIPGCTAVSLVLTSNGLTEVDGVPVINGVIAGVKFAELLVDLKKAGQPWISRKLLYQLLPLKEIEAFRETTIPQLE